MKGSKINLKRVNDTLTIVVIGVALYIFTTPFLPAISLFLKKKTSDNGGYIYQNSFVQSKNNKPIPADNRLVVPSIMLDIQVKQGKNIDIIKNGDAWRLPKTSVPGREGNTVIIGHRFAYKNASSFYNLDKLNIGDRLIVYWEGREYGYVVREKKIVPPSASEVENQTADETLTLYTCHTVWNPKQRLVIVAKPVEAKP